jgi:hypothetical protein
MATKTMILSDLDIAVTQLAAILPARGSRRRWTGVVESMEPAMDSTVGSLGSMITHTLSPRVITNADQQIPDFGRKSMLVFDLAGNGFGDE